MATDFAVSALSRKRAELAAEIIAREAALDQLRADLAHLDAAIRIMCPDAEPELIRRRSPAARAATGLDAPSWPVPFSTCYGPLRSRCQYPHQFRLLG